MQKRPWPSEALIIVASNRGKEIRANMESVVHVNCRDCQNELAADSHTIRRAEELPIRYGRPIEYLCLACASQNYEMPDTIIDDRRRENVG